MPLLHYKMFNRFQAAVAVSRHRYLYHVDYILTVSTTRKRLYLVKKLCGRPPQYAPAPCKLTFDLLTLKAVPESCVTWPTSVPILVFLGLSVLDLGPMYATVRRQTDRRQTRTIA